MSDSPQAPLLIWAGFICRMLAGMSSAKSFHFECLLHAEMACSHPPPLPTPRDNDCMYFLLLWLVLSAITIIIVMLRAQKSMNSLVFMLRFYRVHVVRPITDSAHYSLPRKQKNTHEITGSLQAQKILGARKRTSAMS